MKSVYIAGRYYRRDEFRTYRDKLQNAGVIVTSRWLDETSPLDGKPSDLPDSVNHDIAVTDLLDVARADAMVFFAEDPYAQPPRGGRHVEFGYALGNGKPIYVVGGKENVFHHCCTVMHFDTFEQVVEALR